MTHESADSAALLLRGYHAFVDGDFEAMEEMLDPDVEWVAAGESEATWIVADSLDVALHVFTPEAREYYRLEQLWGEAPKSAVGERTA